MTKPTPSCEIEKARALQAPEPFGWCCGDSHPGFVLPTKARLSRPLSGILSEPDSAGQEPKEAGYPFRPKEPPLWQIATRLQTFPAH